MVRPVAVVGVDLGTSSMKCVAVTPDGALISEARSEYKMRHPAPRWNENLATDWVTAFADTVGQVCTEARAHGFDIRALGLVAQRDPFVMLDEDNEPTSSVIGWTDQRTRTEVEDVRDAIGERRLIEITGNKPVVGAGLTNLLWSRRHLPEAWNRTVRVTSPKDYLLSLISDAEGTDPTTPTRSMAFDVRNRTWSAEILRPLGVSLELFDEIRHEPWHACGTLDPSWARRFGLTTDVVVAAGSADDQAAAIGAGAVSAGQVCLGTGTCSSWRVVTDELSPDVTGQTDIAPHAAPGVYLREATIDSAGSSLRWFRDELCANLSPQVGYDEILAMASTVPIGAAGLQCFPFVDGGQRAPYFEHGATGTFIGITSHHTRAHMARAVIEGVALLYAPTWELLGKPAQGPLTIVDGEASSTVWNQVKADVLGHPIRTPKVLDAAAMGGAILAAVAGGFHSTVAAAVSSMVSYGAPVQPDATRHETYARLADRYADVFAHVRQVYRLSRTDG